MDDYAANIKKIIAIASALLLLVLLSVLPGIARQAESKQNQNTGAIPAVQVATNASGYLSISVSQGEIKQVSLINENGQTLVTQRPRSTSALINVKNYKPGSYFVKVETDTKTIVKQFQKS
jgi:hypothetical protein